MWRMKTLSVKLPDPLANWVTNRSRTLGRTQSGLVREVLERERTRGSRTKTCRDLLADLDGFFDGPEDLSTNPRLT
jgi:hypothetical protein